MSSPTEPGEPDSGAERPVEQGDLPPWQRAERRRGSHAALTGPQTVQPPVARPGGAPTEVFPAIDVDAAPPTTPTPSTAPPATSPATNPVPTTPPPASQARSAGRPSTGLDARLSRFISGTAAPAGFNTSARTENAGGHEPADLETRAIETSPYEWPEPRPEPAYDRPEAPSVDAPWSDSEVQEPVRSTRNADLPDLSAPTPRTSWKSEGAQAVTVDPVRRGPLRAAVQIRRIDPWAMLKVSLVLSVVFFFVWMIAVAILYLVLGVMGVWSKLNENVGELITNSGGGELVSAGTIFGTALLIGLLNIVLMTAAATIGAFIYNLTTDLVGGVEVTLADRD